MMFCIHWLPQPKLAGFTIFVHETAKLELSDCAATQLFVANCFFNLDGNWNAANNGVASNRPFD
jgi:hypothetical protein